MKIYKSISAKNLHFPLTFSETSQKVYSFEGFIYYSLKCYLEAAQVLEGEVFLNWVNKVVPDKEHLNPIVEILNSDAEGLLKLQSLWKLSGIVDPVKIEEINREIKEWLVLPVEIRHSLQGDRLFKEGRFEAALGQYKKAQSARFCPNVEHNIGATYMHLHFFDEAERAFHRALKHSDNIAIHLNLIRLLKISNRTNEALARAIELLKITPTYELHFECGTLYQLKDQLEEAMAHFTKAYELEPREEVLVQMIQVEMEFKDEALVRSYLEHLKAMNLELYFVFSSKLLLKTNQLEEAMELLEEGQSQFPGSKKIALELARICRQKKQIIKAINAITKAQALGADEDEILYEMALIAKRAGNRKDYEHKLELMLQLWKNTIRQRFAE